MLFRGASPFFDLLGDMERERPKIFRLRKLTFRKVSCKFVKTV